MKRKQNHLSYNELSDFHLTDSRMQIKSNKKNRIRKLASNKEKQTAHIFEPEVIEEKQRDSEEYLKLDDNKNFVFNSDPECLQQGKPGTIHNKNTPITNNNISVGITSDIAFDLTYQENPEDDVIPDSNDPYHTHINYHLTPEQVNHLSTIDWKSSPSVILNNSTLGHGTYQQSPIIPSDPLLISDSIKSQNFYICKRLYSKLFKLKNQSSNIFTILQEEFMTALARYQNILYSQESANNHTEIIETYCIHILNHILKGRAIISKNNAKLVKNAENCNEENTQTRDQGIMRPRVLILVPMRNSALKIIECLSKIIGGSDSTSHSESMTHKKRLIREYGVLDENEQVDSSKPEDYKILFDGNNDDCFRLGIKVSPSSLRLYTKFYSADLIIASPLGLKTLMDLSIEDKRGRYDFLSSMEIILLDQAEVFLFQNWEHILSVFNSCHLQPHDLHGVDISRVRESALDNLSKYYCQLIVLSQIQTPELRSLFDNYCNSYRAKVIFSPIHYAGYLHKIENQILHILKKILSCTDYKSSHDIRFNFFTDSILPDFNSPLRSSTLIFVPSYFDYLRIRNYMKSHELSFTQICEYSSDSQINRARTLFYQKRRRFLIITERFYFYRRITISGIRNVIYFGPPIFGNFYSEILNYINPNCEIVQEHQSIILHTQFDLLALIRVLGTECCAKVVNNNTATHIFSTTANDKEY